MSNGPDEMVERLLAPIDREEPGHAYLSWETVLRDAVELTRIINEDSQETGRRIDGLVTLPRGGMFTTMVMSRICRIEAPAIISHSLTTYGFGETRPREEFDEGQVLTESDVYGKVLLAPDDVIDSARTQAHLRAQAMALGAKEFLVAGLYNKPENAVVDLGPYPVIRSYSGSTWLHFPWEGLEHLFDSHGSSTYSGMGYGTDPQAARLFA